LGFALCILNILSVALDEEMNIFLISIAKSIKNYLYEKLNFFLQSLSSIVGCGGRPKIDRDRKINEWGQISLVAN